MKFFIPAAESAERADQVYAAIKTHVGEGMMGGTTFADRKVRFLRWQHDGNEHEAEVGKATSFNGELVIAILYEPARNLYHVCTPNRGVLRDISILAGGASVLEARDFTED
jgi:hypothetical protein